MKKMPIICSTSALMLIGCLTSCNKLTLEQRLQKLDGVKNVTKLKNDPIPGYEIETCKEAYTFTINQPIDWNNKELGTFDQKVNIYYNSDNAITEYKLTGYAIFNDAPLNYYYSSEIQNRYKGSNVVTIDYRFFANSKPEGFSYTGIKYTSYFNSYQASKDFHNIVTQLKTILNGKTIFDGASKGGYTTEMMAYYFPDDIDSYISYVAPLCNSDADPRLHDYVYSEIGNGTYGETKAQEYRDIVKEFQRNALKDDKDFRSKVMAKYAKNVSESKSNDMSDDEVFEQVVCEFATGLWQYKPSSAFDSLKEINDMKEDTSDEIEAKTTAIAAKLKENSSASSDPSFINPYYLQAKMEMGNYSISLDHLRNAGLNIKTTKEREAYIQDATMITEEQAKTLKYTPIFRDALINFYNTTKKDIVKIVGYSDPWYSVRAPETTNPHIHLYKAKGNHTSGINTLEEKERNEAFSIVDKLVGYTK